MNKPTKSLRYPTYVYILYFKTNGGIMNMDVGAISQ